MLPMPRMQKKVGLVLYMGAVLTIAWVIGISAFLTRLEVAFIPLNLPGLMLIGAIMVAPLLVAFGWARRIPRVKKLQCDQCKWSKSWFVEP